MAHLPPVRPEYQRETALPGALPLDTPLPLFTRIWNQTWARKTLVVIVLLALWEGVARLQNNDLMLPGFLQTLRAFIEDMQSGELPGKVANSLGTL